MPEVVAAAKAAAQAADAWLRRVSVVLVAPTHPGNVGAAARAMMNMGLAELRLVAPVADPLCEEALARASRADEILRRARTFATLAEAVRGARRVVGTSARVRGERDWRTARVLAPELVAAAAATEGAGAADSDGGGAEPCVALVFGQERSGLSNEDLDVCTDVCRVSAAAEFPSMNLAQAVLLLGYEVRLAALARAEALPEGAPPRRRAAQAAATAEEMEALFAHYQRTLLAVRFMRPHSAAARMRFLRKILARARLTAEEARFLRGIAERMDYLLLQAGGAPPEGTGRRARAARASGAARSARRR